mgnify:FL=1
MTTLRICTYNIHKGFSQFNRRLAIHDLRDRLRLLGADVVFLQEVQGMHLRHAQRHADWPGQPQHEFLARDVWQQTAYGGNAIYDHGHHGNAILTRFPIRQWCNLDLSVNRLESRGVLHCDIKLPGWPCEVTALCIHLNLFGHDRRKQMEQLSRYIERAVPRGNGLILAGDFNDWRRRANHEFADELGLQEVHEAVHGQHGKSFPARLPILTLDRIYVRGLQIVGAEVLRGAPWATLSDHLPLSAELIPEHA